MCMSSLVSLAFGLTAFKAHAMLQVECRNLGIQGFGILCSETPHVGPKGSGCSFFALPSRQQCKEDIEDE